MTSSSFFTTDLLPTFERYHAVRIISIGFFVVTPAPARNPENAADRTVAYESTS